MNIQRSPGGVLDQTYASERQKKPELRFRYRARTRVVTHATQKYLGNNCSLRVLDLGPAEGLTLYDGEKSRIKIKAGDFNFYSFQCPPV